jgi:hypothetical protein
MIHYNVWFSFKDTIAHPELELRRMRDFLGDLKARSLISKYTLLRSRSDTTRLATYHAVISFEDEAQFGKPFKEVAAAGIHTGLHGLMIEHVDTFIVEIFEEIE